MLFYRNVIGNMLKTLQSTPISLGNRKELLSCLCGASRMSIHEKYGFLLDQMLKRSVHYEPLIDHTLDKKQKEVLENFNITIEDCNLHSNIWTIHPQTIEHHGLVLQEGGFLKLSASLIVNYFRTVRKRIELLKLHNYIKGDTSVTNSFLFHLGNPPIALNHYDEAEYIFIDVYNKILKNFLIWRLDSSEEEIDKILKTYPRIKHKSLKYVSWTLDILEHNLNFSKEKIRRHGYLIHSYPPNTLDTLQRVPILCGEDIKSVFSRHPKIIMTATNTLLNTVKHFKTYNVPDSSVQRCFEIFTLGSDSIKKRLQQMHTVPEFRPYINNPRALFLVHYQRKISARLDHLQDLQRQCASLHVLTSKQSYFEKFARDGIDRSRGNDIVIFLTQRLGLEETVRYYLSRNPFWCSVSCASIQKTLDFLIEKDFKEQDVVDNIHILLYPSIQVDKILNELPTSKVVQDAQKLISGGKSSPNNEITLTKSHQLALCMYFLEKEHHFTGNGVWNNK